MKLILGISSSISAYKAPSLVREFVRRGVDVYCVLTRSAQELVAQKSLETVSSHSVITELYAERDPLTHISLTREADALLIAPATANVIGKLAHGIADDALTTMALAFPGKKYIAPAMNTEMWHAPVVQRNIAYLCETMNYTLIPPGTGDLACGIQDVGRLAELSDIADAVLGSKRDLSGKRFVVTSGATREWIDSIRYITNRSSGKMGLALRDELLARGAEVVYIQGSVSSPAHGGTIVAVDTTEDMMNAVAKHAACADYLIMAAAPLDFKPQSRSAHKIKKQDIQTIPLVENPDIVKKVRAACPSLFIVAFAAESENLITNASHKLKAKGANMIVANNIDQSFESDDNSITIIDVSGAVKEFPRMPKRSCAKTIIDFLPR